MQTAALIEIPISGLVTPQQKELFQQALDRHNEIADYELNIESDGTGVIAITPDTSKMLHRRNKCDEVIINTTITNIVANALTVALGLRLQAGRY